MNSLQPGTAPRDRGKAGTRARAAGGFERASPNLYLSFFSGPPEGTGAT